jgi:hypothetical protein
MQAYDRVLSGEYAYRRYATINLDGDTFFGVPTREGYFSMTCMPGGYNG